MARAAGNFLRYMHVYVFCLYMFFLIGFLKKMARAAGKFFKVYDGICFLIEFLKYMVYDRRFGFGFGSVHLTAWGGVGGGYVCIFQRSAGVWYVSAPGDPPPLDARRRYQTFAGKEILL